MDARLATLLQNLTKKKQVGPILEWLERHDVNAADNLKRAGVSGKNLQLNPLKLTKLKPRTLALLKKHPRVDFELRNLSPHIDSWGGTRRLKKKSRIARQTRSQKRT